LPELPDVTIYVERINALFGGQTLLAVRIASPFFLRSFDPPIGEVEGKRLITTHRIGKQIVLELEDGLFLLFHLMIAGRFHLRKPGARGGLASFDFPPATLAVTEASTKKRASLHLVRGREALAAFRRSGLEVTDATLEQFRAALQRENHTIKRAMTDPDILSGIGNAYSDEILHRARLSPVKLTNQLTDEELARLFIATRETLQEWLERFRMENRDGFPEKVTAFRPDMAVHGRFRQPCPVCGTPVQRIVHAENESNYCPRCQTGGRLLADRALSRLLRQDWPKTIEELEQRIPFPSGRGLEARPEGR